MIPKILWVFGYLLHLSSIALVFVSIEYPEYRTDTNAALYQLSPHVKHRLNMTNLLSSSFP